jgi:hypothetical protein
MTIDGALHHARPAALADTGMRSAECSSAIHHDAWSEPQHASRPRDTSAENLPRRPTLLRGGMSGLQHRALQNPPVMRASLLPPDLNTKDSQLAETLRGNFGLLHPFLKDGRLTLSSLRQVAEATLGDNDKLDGVILAAREINNRPSLRDAILSIDGDITRDSLAAAVPALQGNSSPSAFSQDPFHAQDNAHVVQAFQGLFEQLRDQTKDRTFFFDKHQYVEVAGLRALMRDPDAVGPQGLPVLDPATGLPGKQYSELSVYTAKNILERPGLLRSLERASGTRMFGPTHQEGWISNKGLERWLEQDKAHKAR